MAQKIDLTQRFLNRPILVDESTAEYIKSRSHEPMMVENLRAENQAMWVQVYAGERKPYRMEGSVAVIPINGTLYNKLDWAGYSYTGYDWIRSMLDYAAEDSDVKGIVLDIDSGGGEVDGAFEMAARINEISKEKPIHAALTHGYSAAYLLASATSTISVTQTGGAGSIGVVTAHVDLSKFYEKMGVKVTLIHKGKHKVDGNPYEALPKEVLARIDARLEETYSLFVDTVASYRSMDTQAVRDTEALTYGAKEAVSLGLVDSISSPGEAIVAFVAELNGKQWGNTMTVNAETTQTTTQAASGNEASTVVNQSALDAAKAEGAKTGAEGERARIMGIMKLEETKGREALANVLCEQGMSVDAAKAILAAAPKAQETASTTGGNDFANAMAGTANPELTNDQTTSAESEVPAWKKAMQTYSQASGQKFDNLN